MKNLRFFIGIVALAVVVVIVVACSKEKTAQQETTTQDVVVSGNLTLAEMIEAMSWEDGKAFFENQPIKDYTAVCEKVLNDCEFAEKSASCPTYIFAWHWPSSEDDCMSEYKGICFGIKQESNSSQSNVMSFFADGKLVIVPVEDEDGFTADGYLAIGTPIEIQNDSIVVESGIYTAYYDEEMGRYIAVAVDYSIRK